MSFERSNINAMHGYVPGEQPDSGEVIKLNTNENPYPPPPAVTAALADIDAGALRRYPPPTAREFRAAVAAYHGLLEDQVIPTNGGDELLRLAITTFAGPGDTVAIATPSYSLYPVLTEIQGCRLLQLPLAQDWRLPGDFAQRLRQNQARLAMLVNPHAPSGLLTSAAQIIDIAAGFNGVLLVDEAYVDFVDPEQRHNLVAQLAQHDNLLLLRTLSKGYSLAGLRVGYGLGAASLIAPMLFKTRDSYNIDYIAQKLATAAIRSATDAAETWALVRRDRDWLGRELARLGLAVMPSQANFLLAEVPPPLVAESLYQQLKANGILVRYFDQDRLRDKLRITVGTPEQNRRLIVALEAILRR